MQPPPQAVPSSLVGPPPAGTPQSMYWSNSPYRRQAVPSGPAAPVPCPVQPVTDPFAFSRQALQSPAAANVPHSGIPVLQAQPASLQHPGQSLPPTSAGHSAHGPFEPLPRPLLQPKPEASPFVSLVAPAVPLGLEMNRGTEAPSISEPQVSTLPYPPQYIPAGPDVSQGVPLSGNVPGPDRPRSRQNPYTAAVSSTVPPSGPLPGQAVPGQWESAQGALPASAQHSWPCPEGPVPLLVPQVSRAAHFPASLHQGSGHDTLNPPGSVPAPVSSLYSGNTSATGLDPESTFQRNSRVGVGVTGLELRPAPTVAREHMQTAALLTLPAQGNNSESHLHPQPGDSGALSVFFQGGETENEENLSYEKPGSVGLADSDNVVSVPGPGHLAHAALLRGPGGENVQLGGEAQAYFVQSLDVQHERKTIKGAPPDPWGDPARVGAPEASGPQYENVENLEFVPNQEVLPSEPLGVELSPSDQPRTGLLPGPANSRLGVSSYTGATGPNLEAPDAALHPLRPDSASSSHSTKSLRSLPGSSRPQDLVGTFIQQEVGKPEDEASGSFFKQIDSSPIGGEADEVPGSQSYQNSLSHPPTPSPPKPTGVFQTSANSSFEPVKSHLVGMKPLEADRANMVGEVRDTHGLQKQSRMTAAPSTASPGNLEQPPDNMETLFTSHDGPASETDHGPARAGVPHSDAVLPTSERRTVNRMQGAVKCESPATTLWAQNELPDFGGNVLLAPAAPMLHVPISPRPCEVIQPPDEGISSQRPTPRPPLLSGDTLGASENLENPPKMGEEEEEEDRPSQASPPTEPLPCQLTPFPESLLSPAEKQLCWGEALVGKNLTLSSGASWDASGGEALRAAARPHTSCSPLLLQRPGPAFQNLFPGSLELAAPGVLGSEKAATSGSQEDAAGTLDFLLPRTLANPIRMYGLSHSDASAAGQQPVARCPGLGAHNSDPFYQQVTRDTQEPQGPDKAQRELVPPSLPEPKAPLAEPSNVGIPPGPGLSQNSAQPPVSQATADTGQQPPPSRPPPSSSGATAAPSNQAAVRPDQQWPQSPPPDYYYYRPLYDSYQSQYPAPYPPEPSSGSLYYQVGGAGTGVPLAQGPAGQILCPHYLLPEQPDLSLPLHAVLLTFIASASQYLGQENCVFLWGLLAIQNQVLSPHSGNLYLRLLLLWISKPN